MNPHRPILLSSSIVFVIAALLTATGQSPNTSSHRGKNGASPDKKSAEPRQNSEGVGLQKPRALQERVVGMDQGPAELRESTDNVKLAVDLVVLDAQVLQQKTGRVVGTLQKEDFALTEDGVKQEITHFSQDTLPLSVLLLIDRGGCLDPFSDKVKHATLGAIQRLRPQDEVALMAFANTTDLVAGFGRGKDRILNALDRVPPHDEEAGHCFNRAFYDAADYMRAAGNPDGRRVIIVITGITAFLDCPTPSGQEAHNAVLESGSVVCGIIPKTPGQRIENGVMIAAAGIGGLFKAKTSSLKQLADETGGEVLSDKPENLDHTFNELIDHLRTRYTLGFVSTNRKRDGTFRKLKLDVTQPTQKTESRLVVKTRRGYIAAKEAPRRNEPHNK